MSGIDCLRIIQTGDAKAPPGHEILRARAAQEILEEAGWTWDDDGNPHYPEDVNPDPHWPADSEPADHSDEFPCVEDLTIKSGLSTRF